MIIGPKTTSPVSQNSSNDFSGLKNFFYPECHSYFPIEYLYGIQRPIDHAIVAAIFQLDAAKKVVGG